MNITSRIGDKGQPWRNPTPTENVFDFVPRIQTQLSLCLYKARMARTNGPGTPYSLSTLHRIHTWRLVTFACLRDLCQAYGRGFPPPESSDSASSTEDRLEFLKVLFPPPGNEHSLSKPCFPFLSRRTVCQNFLEANRKSFSIASPNSSHTRVFASVTAEAAALLACRYLSAASGDLWSSQARKGLLLQLSGFLHCWCPPTGS
ncbi:hypothetical protein N1851_018694 [Merluccius polli]|uniref:Uncharacterized protein n=1 Tax=Merluccius polli TaxID=89951 RepID=A0AA47MN89_MERPO|nr:hypothetical protein N1851_018694 [Merluccius polli]